MMTEMMKVMPPRKHLAFTAFTGHTLKSFAAVIAAITAARTRHRP